MATETPYDRRVERVRDALTAHSALGLRAAAALAEHVLEALDTIPEKVR